jgi:hypothetical protein
VSGASGEDDPDQDSADALDILTITEAMGAHFHEHHHDILRWPWKLFCAKWARMIKQLWEQKQRDLAREQERERQRGFDELAGAGGYAG